MADPPWDIHMELPYGTMSDDEMRQLGIPTLQDDGLIFLWVTGRSVSDLILKNVVFNVSFNANNFCFNYFSEPWN